MLVAAGWVWTKPSVPSLFFAKVALAEDARPIPTPLANGQVVYVVVEGDTLDSISAEFGISATRLRDLNRLPDDADVITGMRLLLARTNSVDGESEPTATAELSPTATAEPSPPTATITPTLTPTNQATQTPQATATVQPTATPTVTPTATLTPTATTPSTPAPTLNPLWPTPVTDGRVFHIVESGDSLLTLAERYQLTIKQLLTLNGLDDSTTLFLGQKILLGYGATSTPVATATPKRDPLPELSADGSYIHIIQAKDTVYGVALRYGLTPQHLLILNKLDDDSVLKSGDELILGYPETLLPNKQNIAQPSKFASTRVENETFIHIVQSGDTVERLSKRYEYETVEKFLEVTGLESDTILKVGAELVVGRTTPKEPEIVATETATPTLPPTATSTRRPTVTPTPSPTPTETPLPTATPDPTLAAPSLDPEEPPKTNYLAFLGLFASLLLLGAITLYLWLDRHNHPKQGNE